MNGCVCVIWLCTLSDCIIFKILFPFSVFLFTCTHTEQNGTLVYCLFVSLCVWVCGSVWIHFIFYIVTSGECICTSSSSSLCRTRLEQKLCEYQRKATERRVISISNQHCHRQRHNAILISDSNTSVSCANRLTLLHTTHAQIFNQPPAHSHERLRTVANVCMCKCVSGCSVLSFVRSFVRQ